MVMQIAQEDVAEGATGQRKEHDEFEDRKTAARFLRGRLGIAFLVFGGVGQLGGGAVHHFDRAALELAGRAHATIGGLGGGAQGLHLSGVAVIDRTLVVELKERLDLANDLAAGGLGFEELPEEALERQPQGENALAAVRSLLFGGKQRSGQQVAQVLLGLGQGGLANGLGGAPAQGGQPRAEGREAGCQHRAVILPPY